MYIFYLMENLRSTKRLLVELQNKLIVRGGRVIAFNYKVVGKTRKNSVFNQRIVSRNEKRFSFKY